MSTYIVHTIDDLDDELKARTPAVANMADFTSRRQRAYRRALADLESALMAADDPFIRTDNAAAPITVGTEKLNTTVGDIYAIALPADALRVAGNAILVGKASTAQFLSVPRLSWDAVVPSGGSQTPYAFWEQNGKIALYDKDGNFDNTNVVIMNYYRQLSADQTGGADLDIRHTDFGQIATATLSGITG